MARVQTPPCQLTSMHLTLYAVLSLVVESTLAATLHEQVGLHNHLHNHRSCSKPLPTLRSRSEMGALLQKEGFRAGVELGVQFGHYSAELLSSWLSCQEMYLVDAWAHQERYKDIANKGKTVTAYLPYYESFVPDILGHGDTVGCREGETYCLAQVHRNKSESSRKRKKPSLVGRTKPSSCVCTQATLPIRYLTTQLTSFMSMLATITAGSQKIWSITGASCGQEGFWPATIT